MVIYLLLFLYFVFFNVILNFIYMNDVSTFEYKLYK